MTDPERIEQFFAGEPHAIVGASRDPSKYGNMVLRAFKQNDLPAFPVNPNAVKVEGLKAYANLGSLPESVHGVCVITPPHVTDAIIEQAGRLGIKNIWLQPGAETEHSVQRAMQLGMNIIAGGPCVLVALRFRQ